MYIKDFELDVQDMLKYVIKIINHYFGPAIHGSAATASSCYADGDKYIISYSTN